MQRACWLLVCGAALVASTGAAQPGSAPPPRIDCTADVCRTDLATYIGWRVFHAQCATCHAADAVGSSFAPDLTQRLRNMSEREFVAALDDGYLGRGMQPRGRNPAVAPYYRELWSYLAARRDGVLPPGPVEPRTD